MRRPKTSRGQQARKPFLLVGLWCFLLATSAHCQVNSAHTDVPQASARGEFTSAPSAESKKTPHRYLPILGYKTQKNTLTNFHSSVQPFPLKHVYYGIQEGQAPHHVNSLVEEEYFSNQMRRTQYTIEPPEALDAYIFDPMPIPGGEWILFKFGRADLSIDGFGLYLFNFNRRTHQVKTIIDEWLVNIDIQIAPSGHFISFVLHGGRSGISTHYPATLELWVHDLANDNNTRVAHGNTLQYTVGWLGSESASSPSSDELNYSLTQKHKLANGEGTLLVPTAYIYNCTTRTYRTWPEASNVTRPSPDGHWLLFAGSKDPTKDPTKDFITKSPSQSNYGLFLRRAGTPDKPQPALVPENVIPG